MQMNDLHDLFVHELRDLYSAEKQLVAALPKMARKAKSTQLRQSFTQHLEQTRDHVDRLDRIFRKLGVSSRGPKCQGMEGLIEEGKDLIEDEPEPEVLDAGLIAAAQKVEHYEIAGYGTVRTYAQLLGDDESARLLQQTLDEEGETDKKLTRLAVSSVNLQAQA
jgi:ferritin-like metal-binding protein YciE